MSSWGEAVVALLSKPAFSSLLLLQVAGKNEDDDHANSDMINMFLTLRIGPSDHSPRSLTTKELCSREHQPIEQGRL